MIEGVIPSEILEGPAAIHATVGDASAAAREAASFLAAHDVRRIFVIGNGTSYHSALAAAALHGRMAGPDDAIAIARTAGDFRTYPPNLGPRDAVIGISASGEFADVVATFEELRDRVPTVGIVHVRDSRLARIADRVVLSAGGPSRVPVMTKTFSATLVATELTLVALLGDVPFRATSEAIEAAADHAAVTIASAGAQLDELVEVLDRYRHVFVVGAGLAHVAGLEAALKLKEIALVHAEGGETWEVTSGAATMIDDRSAVIVLAPPGPGRGATADLVRHVATWGAAVIEIGPERMVAGSRLIDVPPSAEEDHAPLTAVPPVALVAFALARRRGIDPDRPDWVARYHSQGLRHIVGVDPAGSEGRS